MSELEKIELEKINFIGKYGGYLQANILSKVENNGNVMTLILSILMSNKRLEECTDYKFLIDYVNKCNLIEFKIDIDTVKNIISTIRGFANRIYHNDKTGQKIEMKLVQYNIFLDTLKGEKQYIKQA